jgi:fructose-specific component phosphotransferase system IIB-like protein
MLVNKLMQDCNLNWKKLWLVYVNIQATHSRATLTHIVAAIDPALVPVLAVVRRAALAIVRNPRHIENSIAATAGKWDNVVD